MREVALVAVAAIELFPGLYPQDGPLVIVNLDDLFDQMGGQYPYDVWIDYAPGSDLDAIAAGVRALGLELIEVRDVASLVRAEQARLLRQGLFGLLSIGFVAAGGLTIAGFLAAAAMTARQRTVELGVLRAIGMGADGAVAALAIEQGVAVLAGLLAGDIVAACGALLVVPALTVGVGPHPGTPPVSPQIGWGDLALAAALAAAVLLALARRAGVTVLMATHDPVAVGGRHTAETKRPMVGYRSGHIWNSSSVSLRT